MMTRSKTRALRLEEKNQAFGLSKLVQKLRTVADLSKLVQKLRTVDGSAYYIRRDEECIPAFRALAVYIDHNFEDIKENIKMGLIWDSLYCHICFALTEPLLDTVPESKRAKLKSFFRRVRVKIVRAYEEIGETWIKDPTRATLVMPDRFYLLRADRASVGYRLRE